MRNPVTQAAAPSRPFPHGSTWKEDEDGIVPLDMGKSFVALNPSYAYEKFMVRFSEVL